MHQAKPPTTYSSSFTIYWIIFELYKLAIKCIFVRRPCQREPSPWSLPWSSRQPLRARWSQGTWPDGVLIIPSWHILYLWAVFDRRSSPTPCSSSSLTSTTGSFILKEEHNKKQTSRTYTKNMDLLCFSNLQANCSHFYIRKAPW